MKFIVLQTINRVVCRSKNPKNEAPRWQMPFRGFRVGCTKGPPGYAGGKK